MKLHKIKPLTELEDDLANKDRISIKTFFALCVLEGINVLLVNKRKVYELLCADIDKLHPLNIIHRNTETYEHSIELDPTEEIITKYRENYYKMSSFDATLKSMWADKLPLAQPRLYWKEKTKKFGECEYCNWKTKCKAVENGTL
jgi:hypothetical protein